MHSAFAFLSFLQPSGPDDMTTATNEAYSVDAPIARLLHIVHPWRRATDAHF